MKRLVTTLGLAILAVVAIGCSSAAGGGQPPASAGPVDPNAPVIVAQNNVFSPATLTVEADKAFSLTLDNKDAAPHNVAIFKDASAAESVSIGEIVSSTTVTQQVPALAAGEYFFRCDIHKEMTGTIVAE
jgi:plastocyanin